MGLKFSDFLIDKQQQEQAEKAISDKEYLEQLSASKTASSPAAPKTSGLDISGIKAGAAAGANPTSSTSDTEGSDKYYALQKEYIDKYFGREGFSYDVNADELYEIYRKQALDTAEKARRNATAEAAGLTGGYGSSYASAAGNSAYSDIMQDADAMLPEFMELARARYDNEGKELLSRAEILGSLGDSIYERESSYFDMLSALGGSGKEKDGEALLASERAVNNASFKYDGSYKDYKGNTTAAELVNAMLEDGVSKAEILAEFKGIASDDEKDEDGYRFSSADLDYIENMIDSYKNTAYINGLVGENGESLADYYNQLIAAAEVGDLTAEEVIYALTSWKDKSGKGLDEQTILSLIG